MAGYIRRDHRRVATKVVPPVSTAPTTAPGADSVTSVVHELSPSTRSTQRVALDPTTWAPTRAPSTRAPMTTTRRHEERLTTSPTLERQGGCAQPFQAATSLRPTHIRLTLLPNSPTP